MLTLAGSLSIEPLEPNKTEVLQLLSGCGRAPARYAKATIMFGATEEPYLQDFMIGPVPITNASTVQPYSFRSTRGGDSKVRVFNPDMDAYANFNQRVLVEAADVTKFLWNLVGNLSLKSRRRAVANNMEDCGRRASNPPGVHGPSDHIQRQGHHVAGICCAENQHF